MRLALVLLAACGSQDLLLPDAGIGFPDEGGFPTPVPPDTVTCTNFCDHLCVDTRSDPMNCGGCAIPCTGATSECVDSTCVEPGATRWMRSFAGQVNAVAVDESGNVFAAGSFTGTLDLGQAITLTSAGDTDAFLGEWTPQGEPMWAKRFGGVGADAGTTLLYNGGALIFGLEFTGALQAGVTSYGGTDIFVQQLTPDGQVFGSGQYGGPGNDTLRGLAFSALDSQVAMCGSFSAGVFHTTTTTLTSQATTTGYIASFLIGGNTVFERPLGDVTAGHNSACTGVAYDSVGNIDIAGTFDGSATFWINPITVPTQTAYLAQYTFNGNSRWVRAFTGGTSSATALALDPGGNPAVVGNFSGSVDFGNGALTASTASDGYLASFTRNGGPALSRRYGDTVAFTAIAYDGADVLATGHASTAPDFGTGGDDMFVARLSGTAIGTTKRYGAGAGTSIAVAPSGAFIVGGQASGSGLLLEQNP